MRASLWAISLCLSLAGATPLTLLPIISKTKNVLNPACSEPAALCGEFGQVAANSSRYATPAAGTTLSACFDACNSTGLQCLSFAWTASTLCQLYSVPIIRLGFEPGNGPAWHDMSCPGLKSRVVCGTNYTVDAKSQSALSSHTLDTPSVNVEECGALCSGRGDCYSFGYADNQCVLLNSSAAVLPLSISTQGIAIYDRGCASGNVPTVNTTDPLSHATCQVSGGSDAITGETLLASPYRTSSAACRILCQQQARCLSYATAGQEPSCLLMSAPVSALDLGRAKSKQYVFFDRECDTRTPTMLALLSANKD